MKIKAISLHQPYADFIIQGHKRFETRSWSVSYRGLVAMHAARKWDDETIHNASSIHRMYPAIPLIEKPALGAMLGICRLLDCVPTESIVKNISAHERAVGGWATGRFAWEMEVLEVFETPIEAKGQQGLFDWEFPEEILSKRIAVIGSRDYEDLEAVRRYISTLPKDTVIVSGGARGVDKAAEDAAKAYGLKAVVVNVNTKGLPQDEPERSRAYGQRAMIRNGEILALSGSVAAFWDGKSVGTKGALEKAEKAGMPIQLNPTVEIKEAPLTQMKLAGFSSTYDEGAYISALEKGRHFSSGGEKETVEAFEWEWPWLATKNDVWVRNHGGYRLIPKESDEAKKWANILRGWMYQSETLNLREWLKAQENNFIPLPCEYVELNRYAIDDILHAVKESDIRHIAIPVEQITFTQASYNPGICLKYLEAGTVSEFESGTLPMIYRFQGDARYFATNGSHRALGWLLGLDPNRRAALPVRFCEIPYSLEALQERVIELEDDEAKLEFYADVLREALSIIGIEKSEECETDELVTA